MQVDPGVGFQPLQRRYAADMIEVSVRDGDRLQVQTQSFESFNNPLSFISGIDADGLPGGFARDDARVLLEGGYGQLFYDHRWSLALGSLIFGLWPWVFGLDLLKNRVLVKGERTKGKGQRPKT